MGKRVYFRGKKMLKAEFHIFFALRKTSDMLLSLWNQMRKIISF